ncbi:hypothetical protein LWI29_013610 [Acer saccharum]|uniref:Uncharacterized protein n=1 Tax=Acer saccharum TaxID=4024 RepID=A0AA39VDG1_ACESA|nr:hypothetical protein LWI29_013610 [Acer saccharum]
MSSDFERHGVESGYFGQVTGVVRSVTAPEDMVPSYLTRFRGVELLPITMGFENQKYTKALKPGGNFNFGDFMGKVRKDYILAPSRSQVYQAKNKAGEIIQGSLYAQYGKLRDYAEELKRSNQGSTVVIDTELGANEEHIFRRIYICLNACKVGWLAGCRLIICLDACFTKSQ